MTAAFQADPPARPRRATRAFTLVELLVVVAIIATLIGILLPVVAAARRTALAAESLVALRTLLQSHALYANDHDGALLPAHLTAQQAQSGVYDEFGGQVYPPVSQRWSYRLAPYFDYAWAGTTHVGAQADLLRQFEAVTATGGEATWTYLISIFPSFGLNRLYVGGDYNDRAAIAAGHHVRRLGDALDPSGLLVHASARHDVGAERNEGFVWVTPPPLGSRYDPAAKTTSPATAFGNLHLRYGADRGTAGGVPRAAVGWLDGHAGLLGEAGLLDRRNWADPARRLNDPSWEPTP